MTPEGDVETNTHAFGEKWRVIDRVTVAGFQNEEPYVDTKPFVDLCETDKKKKEETEKLCNKLNEGVFRSKSSITANLSKFILKLSH